LEIHSLAAKLRLRRQLFSLTGHLTAAVSGRAHQRCAPSNLSGLLYFFMVLPLAARTILADDLKLLIGWASEAAALKRPLAIGEIVDAGSSFARVPWLGGSTDLRLLKSAYRIALPPLKGPGYHGIVLAVLDQEHQEVALLLINRLFRLPLIMREPFGVATDILTVGALLFGIRTPALKAAAEAASTAYERANALGIPLITCGQSLAGGVAQFQIAALLSARRSKQVLAGFLTYNAAHSAISIERFGLKPEDIAGINFSKDRDPGVGPHSLLPNRAGVQIYIHSDGTGGFAPRGSFFSALLHPWEHLLRSFNSVSLGEILAPLNLSSTES
jgi:hypothetical protein